MTTITAPAMTVLAIEGKTNMQNLHSFIGDKPKELVREAVKAGLHPTGPQYWIYEWTDLNPEADFKLKICLPVAIFGESNIDSQFVIEKLSGFKHIKATHLGAWETMNDTYNQVMGEMAKNNIIPGTVCREVYVNCDFEHPENNITEIQFGVLN